MPPLFPHLALQEEAQKSLLGWSEEFLCSLEPGCSALGAKPWALCFGVGNSGWEYDFFTPGKIASGSRSPKLLDAGMQAHPLPFPFSKASSAYHAQKEDQLRGTLP